MNPLFEIYCDRIPDWLFEYAKAPSMQRLKKVGMNCGCEYTSFPLFRDLNPYSRHDHSVGVALIVYHFTHDKKQSLSALFHDIATPVFAHTIDFLNGDYLKQESTEKGTVSIITNDRYIVSLLRRDGIEIEEVSDYHRYPIADNASPKLSADRLEYTLGNLLNFGFRDIDTIKKYYRSLQISINEYDEEELVFTDEESAVTFAHDTLKCSRVYTSDEDRYSMQILSELIRKAICRNTLSPSDLYQREDIVIDKLKSDPVLLEEWTDFTKMSRMIKDSEGSPYPSRIVDAKKRYIDPYVKGKGRASELSLSLKEEIVTYRNILFDYPLKAEGEDDGQPIHQ